MQYTAIIKDGGLFIPNVFADLNDGGAHIVQATIDIDAVRQQLSTEPKLGILKQESLKTTAPKASASQETKKPVKKQPKKDISRAPRNPDLGTQRQSAVDELSALDDSELSEILKAYMNDGHAPAQISLENL